jgi:hypothetical protein
MPGLWPIISTVSPLPWRRTASITSALAWKSADFSTSVGEAARVGAIRSHVSRVRAASEQSTSSGR